MKIIEEIHDLPPYRSKLYDIYFDKLNVAVIDIETTGLSPANSAAILVGILKKDGNKVRVTQFFAETLSEEPLILEATKKHLEGIDYLLSFNGHRFDIPFLRKRAEHHNMTIPKLESYHLDLYHVVRKYSALKAQLPNLKQKTIENYMGFWKYREDVIDGGESVNLYYDYLLDPRKEYLDKILLHNKEDVLNLYRLTAVADETDFHQSINGLGIPVLTDRGLYTIESSKIKGNSITISGAQSLAQEQHISSIIFESQENPIFFSFTKGKIDEKGIFSITAKNLTYKGRLLKEISYAELNSLSASLLTHAIKLAT